MPDTQASRQPQGLLLPKAPVKYLKEVSARLPWEPPHISPTFPRPDLSTSFPAIGTAYAVLSNPEKRKQYDQFGDDKSQAARHGHGHGDFHRGFEADISPEDLFNMFFGGGFPSSKFPNPPHSHVTPGGDGGGLDASLSLSQEPHS